MVYNTGFVLSPVLYNTGFVRPSAGVIRSMWSCCYLILQVMLPAQLANVAAAALPRPPTVQIFLDRLCMSLATPTTSVASRELYGDTFAEADIKPLGTDRNQKKALGAALDFAKALEHKQVVITDLDEWMTAFAQWTLGVEWLFESKEAAEAALAQRNALCEAAGVAVRCWVPQTLKTNVNAMALMYKQSGAENCVVPGVETQFPRFNRLFNVACTRQRTTQARQPLEQSLTCQEVERLFDKTEWKSWYQSQRMNLLLMAYQLGQRPETLIRLSVGQFHVKRFDDGTEGLQIHFGTMKNLQGNQANVSKALHKQYLKPHKNSKLCAVAAYHRQLSLVGKPSDLSVPLFRSARFHSKSAPPKEASYNVIRGIALWARAEVGRPITFKDCARRPVLTRLANALPVHEAARAVGVAPRTIDRYHTSNAAEVSTRAAIILAQVG